MTSPQPSIRFKSTYGQILTIYSWHGGVRYIPPLTWRREVCIQSLQQNIIGSLIQYRQLLYVPIYGLTYKKATFLIIRYFRYFISHERLSRSSSHISHIIAVIPFCPHCQQSLTVSVFRAKAADTSTELPSWCRGNNSMSISSTVDKRDVRSITITI